MCQLYCAWRVARLTRAATLALAPFGLCLDLTSAALPSPPHLTRDPQSHRCNRHLSAAVPPHLDQRGSADCACLTRVLAVEMRVTTALALGALLLLALATLPAAADDS